MSEAALIGDTQELTRFILLITGLLVIRTAASAASTLILARFSAKAGFRLRALFVNHFLRVPFSKLEKTPSGELLSIYSNDVPHASNLVAAGLLGLVGDLIMFLSAFSFLIWISPGVLGSAALAVLGMLVLQVLLSLPIQKGQVKVSESEAKFNAVVNDSLQNLSVVAAYSLDEVLEKRYMKTYMNFYVVIRKFIITLAVVTGIMMVILLSPLIIIVTILAITTVDGGMTLAEFIAFSTTMMLVGTGVMGIAQRIGGLATNAGGAKRLMDNTADELECSKSSDSELHNGDIIFNNVTFSYNSEDLAVTALSNASFTIPQGGKVAIVGGSGSGKSTILKLLLGLYEPTDGDIFINGTNITDITKDALRNMSAYVPQNSFLFPDGIGKNITLADTLTDPARLEAACKNAGILDFINSLPDKFDGVLTESADNVSGGQRQRIAMARAFYKNAPIILFDEATSSLDPITESQVLASFDTAAENKTVIIVAHRASAIAGCDTIIAMDNGAVAGIGTHDELLSTCEAYRNLYERGAA